MTKKRILIIGAGPGGLTAGMILAHRGFDVRLFESKAVVGGRNAPLKLGPYTFDTGPTFLMMDFVLREAFQEAGARVEDHLQLHRLDPMYRLLFDDRTFNVSQDPDLMRAEIERHFPGNAKGYDRFIKEEGARFQKLLPCLTRDYSSLKRFTSPVLMRALPYLGLGRSVFENLSRYFSEEKLVLAFTFQAKYLGMSAWHCPALFTMLPYVEHAYGIYHVQGGLNQISRAMKDVFEANGGQLHLSTPVKSLLFDGDKVTGVQLENGEIEKGDAVVVNADFGYAMSHLVPPEKLRRYSAAKLEKKKLSCSTFMLYLGLNKTYTSSHHTIAFAADYKKNVGDIFENDRLSGEDFSFYVQNASVTDPTLAPAGHSTLYVLVPVPNQRAGLDWRVEGPAMRTRVLQAIERRTDFKDLSAHIEVERMITPADWQSQHIYQGATFNLSHNFSQLLYFRPHNEFEEFKNCYLVGGGTHPGSGLPVIYESARISSDMIAQRFGADASAVRNRPFVDVLPA